MTTTRIGIAHPDRRVRRGVARSFRSDTAVGWTPGGPLPDTPELDVALVAGADEAARISRRWPAASIVLWVDRPVRDRWAGDAWIDAKLAPADAAGVLSELLASGLLARNHGPTSPLTTSERQD